MSQCPGITQGFQALFECKIEGQVLSEHVEVFVIDALDVEWDIGIGVDFMHELWPSNAFGSHLKQNPVEHCVMEVRALNGSALVNDLGPRVPTSLFPMEPGNSRMCRLSAGFFFRAVGGSYLIIRSGFLLQDVGEVILLSFQFEDGCLVIKEGDTLIIDGGYRARGIWDDTILAGIEELIEAEVVRSHWHGSRQERDSK